MRKNPCRNCEKSFVYKNRHTPGWDCRFDCEKYKKHENYLESKRTFEAGETITSLEELLNEEWIMWGRSPRHIEVIKCMQLASVLRFIGLGYFRKAIRKEVVNE